MPWPMTLTLTNEAIRGDNRAKKTLIGKKYYRNDLGDHARFKDSITIKKAQDFIRVGERGIEFIVLTYLLLIYRTSSLNGITLWILSCSILFLR